MIKTSNLRLKKLLRKHEKPFQEKLPSGLPPKRYRDHAIEREKEAKPSHRPLYQLSLAELKAVKIYVEDLLRKGKIRPSKSPSTSTTVFRKRERKAATSCCRLSCIEWNY